MYRAAIVAAALMLAPAAASAQQPCTTDARHVVDELYRHMLERTPDENSAHWVQQLESGNMTVRDVVRQIARSEEHLNRFFYQEPGERAPYYRSVSRFYRHLLGRQPDEAGALAFAEVAERRGPAFVIDQILDSPEYEQQFGAWGVPGSGGIRYCAPNRAAARGRGSFDTDTEGRDDDLWRFRAMDRNNDGFISRAEWRGSRQAFAVHDWNNDGVLSGDEVRVGPAASAVGTSGQLVVVNPNRQWVDSGITVRAGEILRFDVDGQVQLSANESDVAQAAGALTGRLASDAPLPQEPAGALIGRIGNSAPFGIGNQRSIRAPASGRLYLGINDDHLPDNSGEFRVIVDAQ